MRLLNLLFGCMLFSCMLLAACGSQKAADSGAVQEHDHKPSMTVQLDISGRQATVNIKTDMKISAEHYGQAREAGEGHIHMYLDEGEKIGVKEGRKVFTELQPGPHTLKVSLHNNDHTPYDVTKTLHFEIK
jgi:hypothetical protein